MSTHLTRCGFLSSHHAFRDLRAYVCTCGGLECDGAFFGDRDSWFEHELREHRAPYFCVLCCWGPRPRKELGIHLSESHASFPDDQRKMLEDAGRRVASEFLAQDCPFCNEWADKLCLLKTTSTPPVMAAAQDVSVTVARFKRHIATHQEELAIIALPQALGDTGTPASGSAATRPSTAPSISSLEGEELENDHQDAAEQAPAVGSPTEEQAQQSNSGKLDGNEGKQINNHVLWCEFSELLGCEKACTSNGPSRFQSPPPVFLPQPQH